MNIKIVSTIILSAMFFISACDDQGDPIAAVVIPPTGISFLNDIRPLITTYGCAGCHGNSGGFSVATHATIITRVIPGNGAGSLLVKRLKGEGVSQMPQGRQPMTTGEIQKFVDWIVQGALNN